MFTVYRLILLQIKFNPFLLLRMVDICYFKIRLIYNKFYLSTPWILVISFQESSYEFLWWVYRVIFLHIFLVLIRMLKSIAFCFRSITVDILAFIFQLSFKAFNLYTITMIKSEFAAFFTFNFVAQELSRFIFIILYCFTIIFFIFIFSVISRAFAENYQKKAIKILNFLVQLQFYQYDHLNLRFVLLRKEWKSNIFKLLLR